MGEENKVKRTEPIPLRYSCTLNNPQISYWIGTRTYDDQGRIIEGLTDTDASQLPGRYCDDEGNVIKEGSELRQATLKDVLEYQSTLSPNHKKKTDGCIHTYIADYTWKKEEIIKRGIRSDGVVFIDIDHTSHAQEIYDGFEKLLTQLSNLSSMCFSASGALHVFMLTPSCNNDEYLYNVAYSNIYLVEAIKRVLGIDLYQEERERGENIIDGNALIKITQKVYLHGSPYKWNENAIPGVYGKELRNQLEKLDQKGLIGIAERRAKGKKEESGLKLSLSGKKKDIKDLKTASNYLDHNMRWWMSAVLQDLGYTSDEVVNILRKLCPRGDYSESEFEEKLLTASKCDPSTTWDNMKAKAKDKLKELGFEIKESYSLDPSKFPQLDPKYDIKYDEIIELDADQYLSDVYEFKEGQNVYIHADCGLGKTEFAKTLSKQQPLDIILPMNSILDGKFNFKEDHIIPIKRSSIPNKYVSQAMIWDTFTNIPFSERKKINVFDETHLFVTHSDFRRVAPETIYQITHMDGTKIFTDGTPMGEQRILGDDVKMIRVTRKQEAQKLKKNVTFHITNNPKLSVSKFIDKNYENHLITIRTDQYADEYRDELNKKGIQFVEYRRDKKDDDAMQYINKHKNVPPGTDIILSTKYYEAGIELKRKGKEDLFDSSSSIGQRPSMLIIPSWNADKFAEQEMEQSSNRFRDEDSDIHIFVKPTGVLCYVNDHYDVFSEDIVDMMGNESGMISHDITSTRVKYLDDMKLKGIYDEVGAAAAYFRSFPIVYRMFEKAGYVISIVDENEESDKTHSVYNVLREAECEVIIDKLERMLDWWKDAEQKSCKTVEEIVISKELMKFPEPDYVNNIMSILYKTFKRKLLCTYPIEDHVMIQQALLEACKTERGGVSLQKLTDWYRFNKWNQFDVIHVDAIKKNLCAVRDKKEREEKSMTWWRNFIIMTLLNAGKRIDKKDVEAFFNVTYKKFIDAVELLGTDMNDMLKMVNVGVMRRLCPNYDDLPDADKVEELMKYNEDMLLGPLMLKSKGKVKMSEAGKKGKRVLVDDKVYETVKDAAMGEHLSEVTVRKRIKDEKWNWRYENENS